MPMTCMHHVAVGAFCNYCGTTIDEDLVRAFAFNPPRPGDRVLALVPQRDPDVELFEDRADVMLGECPECRGAVLVSASGWKRCACGTQTTVLR